MILKNYKKRIYTSLMLLSLIFLMFSFRTIMVFGLIILGVLSLLEFFNITCKVFKKKTIQFIFNIFFIIYLSIFCCIFFFFSYYFQLKIILFSLLLGCIASDIGGFVFGKIFKGPKLTKISPNKTITGACGSILLTCLVFYTSIFYFTENINYNIFFVAIIISISCQIGDLFFSFLKRKAKLKDTGNFLPGHGGVLDRLDGILLGIPIGFIFLTLLY